MNSSSRGRGRGGRRGRSRGGRQASDDGWEELVRRTHNISAGRCKIRNGTVELDVTGL